MKYGELYSSDKAVKRRDYDLLNVSEYTSKVKRRRPLRVVGRAVTKVSRSTHGYRTSLPKKLLRRLNLFGDLSGYELSWVLLSDGSLTIKINRKDGSIR